MLRGRSFPTPVFSITSRPEYSFESEYRLLRSPNEDETIYPDNPVDRFRLLPIKLKKIVSRVITHPRASCDTKKKVEQLLRNDLPSRRREDSALRF